VMRASTTGTMGTVPQAAGAYFFGWLTFAS